MSEYCAASEAAGVPPPPYLQLLAVDLLLQQEQHYQAVQLLYSHTGSSASTSTARSSTISRGSLASLAQHLLEKAGREHTAGVGAAGGGGSSAAAASSAGGRLSMTQSAAAAAAGSAAATTATSPGVAMALELALDVMSREAVPELRPVGGASPSSSAAAASVLAVASAAGTATTTAAAGSAGSSRHTSASSSPARQHQQQQQPAAATPTPAAAPTTPPPAAVQKVATAALVQQLLSLGKVVQAARIARTAGGVMALGLPAAAFVEAAAASADAGALAAVYRVMRPHVVDRWPDFEAVRQELCAGSC